MFVIVKKNNSWVMNDEGDFMIKDQETNSIIWIPQSMISFNQQNMPVLKMETLGLLHRSRDPGPSSSNSLLLSNKGNEFDNNQEEYLQLGKTQDNLTANLNDTHSLKIAGNSLEIDGNSLETENRGKCLWEYDATMALISAVEDRYENMYHPKRKKTFWTEISEILIGDEFYYEAVKCKKKWENLIKTYKSTKDLNRKSGRGPTRFPFYDRLDKLLGDKPNNSSPHTIDVATHDNLDNNEFNGFNDNPNISESSSSIENKVAISKNKRKRLTPAMELVKLKEKQYQAKKLDNEEKRESYCKYMEKKMEYYTKKLEMEERKIQALEKLANKE